MASGKLASMRAAPIASLLALVLLAGCVGDVPEEATTPDVTVHPISPSPSTPPRDAPAASNETPADHATPEAPADAPAETPPAAEPAPPEAPPTPPAPTQAEPAAPPPPPPSAPPPSAPDPVAPWPREGSFVRYETRAGQSIPSTFTNSSSAVVTWTYRDGDWRGECEGTWETHWYADGDVERGEFRRTLGAHDPPHWPLFNTRNPPPQGERVDVWLMWDCAISSESMVYAGTAVADSNGGDVRAHTAVEPEEASPYSDFQTAWDTHTGLVMEWTWARSHSGTTGTLVATDAPLASS